MALIFAIGESGTRGDCFRFRLCAAVRITRLCLHSILDYFSDSCQRHTRWYAFVGCCIEVGQGLKHGSFALHVGNKIFVVLIFVILIFANDSWLAKNAKINTSRKLPTIRYFFRYRYKKASHAKPGHYCWLGQTLSDRLQYVLNGNCWKTFFRQSRTAERGSWVRADGHWHYM